MTPDNQPPADLLHHARAVLQSDSHHLLGCWPRAAALLARGGLEAAVGDYWLAREPTIARAPMRTQTLCLAEYQGQEASTRAAYLFSVLSAACHYHPYELPPTSKELLAWIEGVEQVAARLQVADEDSP